MPGGAMLWGWDYAVLPAVAVWRKLRTNVAGELMVAPGAAAAFDTHCYGYFPPNWYPLPVVSAAQPNLRVGIFHGADAIYSMASQVAFVGTTRGLFTHAGLRAERATNWVVIGAVGTLGDGLTNNDEQLLVRSYLAGWNGASWDRLRVDAAYNLQVGVNAVRSTDTSTIAQVAVGVASTAVIAANANRLFAEFVNDSDNVIYLALGTPAVINQGIRLNPNGGSFWIGLTNLYTGAVTAISGVAASNLTVSEG